MIIRKRYPAFIESFMKNNREQEEEEEACSRPSAVPQSSSSSLSLQSSASSPSASPSSPLSPSSAPGISSVDNSAAMSNIDVNSNFQEKTALPESVIRSNDDNPAIAPFQRETSQLFQNDEIKRARDALDQANSQFQSQTSTTTTTSFDNACLIFARSLCKITLVNVCFSAPMY